MAGHVGISKLVDYCSSKFAAVSDLFSFFSYYGFEWLAIFFIFFIWIQVGFDESLRLELEILGAKNVHTTVICPFFIQSTGMFDDVHSGYVFLYKNKFLWHHNLDIFLLI